MAESAVRKPWWRRPWIWFSALFVLCFVLWVQSCSAQGPGEQASEACRDAARAQFGNDYTSIRTTHTKDEGGGRYVVTGVVEETHGGVTSVVRHWNCEDGEITWSSVAG